MVREIDSVITNLNDDDAENEPNGPGDVDDPDVDDFFEDIVSDFAARRTVENLRVPRLTPENVLERVGDAKHVTMTILAAPNREPPYQGDGLTELTDAVKTVYSDWMPDGPRHNYWLREGRVSVMLAVPSDETDVFPEFGVFLQQHLALWDRAYVSIVDSPEGRTKVDTMVYDKFDRMPAKPTSSLFNDELTDDSHLTDEEQTVQRQLWEDYHKRSDDLPRYSYQLTKIVHGDYYGYGFDVLLHLLDTAGSHTRITLPKFSVKKEFSGRGDIHDIRDPELELHRATQLYDARHPTSNGIKEITDEIQTWLEKRDVEYPPEVTYPLTPHDYDGPHTL